MVLDPFAVLRRRDPICPGHVDERDHVQEAGDFERRHCAVYQLVVLALGYQAHLESIRGHHPDEAILDRDHAIGNRCSDGRRGADLARPRLFPLVVGFFLVDGLFQRHARHRR